MTAPPGPSNEAPIATVIVTPRERFGVARRNLESLFEHAEGPLDLVYVDAGSPPELRAWLSAQAQARGFTHLILDHFLAPNEARNLGAAHARGRYLVFVDNDVIVSPGWLEALVACAEETGAGVVAPLICQGAPEHRQIHQAGGRFCDDVDAFFATPPGARDLIDDMRLQGEDIAAAGPHLRRERTQTCEFHCVLVARRALEKVGGFDPEMLATKEHLDFCLSMAQAGESVWLEPASVVTYLFPTRADPVSREDWPYFLLRWSPDWQRRSMERLAAKWGLKRDGFLAYRRSLYGWRHIEGILKPQMRKTPLVGAHPLWWKLTKRAFAPVMHVMAAAAVAADDRRRARLRREAEAA